MAKTTCNHAYCRAALENSVSNECIVQRHEREERQRKERAKQPV